MWQYVCKEMQFESLQKSQSCNFLFRPLERAVCLRLLLLSHLSKPPAAYPSVLSLVSVFSPFFFMCSEITDIEPQANVA